MNVPSDLKKRKCGALRTSTTTVPLPSVATDGVSPSHVPPEGSFAQFVEWTSYRSNRLDCAYPLVTRAQARTIVKCFITNSLKHLREEERHNDVPVAGRNHDFLVHWIDADTVDVE